VTENFRARVVGEERMVAGLRLSGVLIDPAREAVRALVARCAYVLDESFKSWEVLNESFRTSLRAVAEAGEGRG
jgi:hypothetical protein